MTAERIIWGTVEAEDYGEILQKLREGWKLDPFFHTSGRPWTVNDGHVWVLVKGTPEEVAELNPFVELPQTEVAIADKFAGIVDVVEVRTESVEDGLVAEKVKAGFEVFNVLKGLTILVKREDTGVTASEGEEDPREVK